MNQAGDYEKYADIIDLPHHQSATRPHMSVEDRAAQFSPFAALTGYEDAVEETARLTDERIELDEYRKDALNRQLNRLKEQLQTFGVSGMHRVSVTYFVPDERKTGGAYVTVVGVPKKIREYERLIVMADGTEISIGEIIEIVGMQDL